MRIDFSEIEERRVPGMNGGTGEMWPGCTWESRERSFPAGSIREAPSACTGMKPATTSTIFCPERALPVSSVDRFCQRLGM